MKHKYNAITRSLALCIGITQFKVAIAQQQDTQADIDDIERITVVSSFRDVSLTQLDASATILDLQTVINRQSSHIEDLLRIAPNVNFNAGASRGRFVQIRGIGERSQFAEPINPSVSLYVDAFDFSGLAAAALTFDTQQIEVFRGPQATLFGTGALGGAIRLQSQRPTDTADGYVDVQLANEDALRLEAAYGNAINEDVSFRVAGIHNRADGFIDNTFLERDDTNNLDESAAKVEINALLSQNTELRLQYRFYDIDNGYDAFSLDNDRQTRSDEPGFDRQRTHALSAEILHESQQGDWYISATRANHDIGYAFDEDWTFIGFHPSEYSSFDSYFRDVDVQTAEVRFSSNEDAALFDGRTLWTVGAFYKDTTEELSRVYTFSSDFNSEFEPTVMALYGQTQTTLSDKLRLDVGVRVEQFEIDYMHNEGLDVSDTTTVVGGKVSLNYTLDDHFLYGSISRGYKAAGVNPDQRVTDEQRFFDTEFNWNYEIGVKSFWDTLDMSSRLAVFHMRRRDTQVSDFDVLIRDDGTADFIDIIDNADLGTNQGIELELTGRFTRDWQWQANLGYLDATFENFTRSDGSVVDERRQAQAPRWTGYIGTDYAFNEFWTLHINSDITDEFFFSDGHNEISPFTVLVNAELSYAYRDWRVALWSRNILDRTVFTRGFGGFSNDPRDEYAFPEPYFQLGNPRQVGVSLRYQFD